MKKEFLLNCYKNHPLLMVIADDLYLFQKKFIEFIKKFSIPIESSCLNQLSESYLFPKLKFMLVRSLILELHLKKLNQELRGETSEERFYDFIKIISEKPFQSLFFAKYPVLKKIIRQHLDRFRKALQDCLLHFRCDQGQLVSLFGVSSTYKIDEIHASGDSHQGGKQVLILILKNEDQIIKKLVYKPRHCHMLEALGLFIAKLNLHLSKQLVTPKYLLREHYTWVEYIDHVACQSEVQIQKFYKRIGYYLAICHILGGHDVHFENIIAHGEYPVLIDEECFFKPVIQHPNNVNVGCRLVSEIGLLPKKIYFSQSGEGIDFSGILGAHGELPSVKALTIINEGRDDMKVAREDKKIETSKNIPYCDNRKINPLDYEEEILQGFKEVYQVVLPLYKKNDFEKNFLHYFCNKTIRIILRNTFDYAKLLTESYHPALLVSDEKYLQHFLWVSNNSPDFYSKKITETEVKDLLAGDIPAFFTKTDSQVVVNSQGVDCQVRLQSGYDRVLNYLQSQCDTEDLALQVNYIKNSFYIARYCHARGDEKNKFNQPEKIFFENNLDANEAALGLACRLYAILLENSFNFKNKIHFLTLEKIKGKHIQTHLADSFFYQGIAGVVLSLAHGACVLKNERLYLAARSCLATLRENQKNIMQQNVNAGMFTGIGGVLYSLLHLYVLWKDDTILQDIEVYCQLLLKIIQNTELLDLISGISGCLVVLKRLKRFISFLPLQEIMSLGLERFFNLYPSPDQLPNIKNPLVPKPLLGFAHGVSGMSWALSEIYDCIPEQRIPIWIREALEYERKYFSSEKNNWADLRYDPPQYMNAWCHGAIGIGLSRLHLNKQFHDDYFAVEIDAAIKCSLHDDDLMPQNLCHGSLGVFDLFQRAQAYFPDLYQKIFQNYVKKQINFMQNSGCLAEEFPLRASPGFMTGISGIAYQCLRMSAKPKLPSVLLLEV